MAFQVLPYKAAHEAAVRDFNARLRAADALLFPLPETAPESNPKAAAAQIEFRHFVVVDDTGQVRGGYFIRAQPFSVRGEVCSVGHYSAPLSEGIIDRRYVAVGGLMLAHALAEQPLLFAMGMGGAQRPLPRMLRAAGWPIVQTPFYFLVLNAQRFLRNIGPLRAKPGRRLAADILAISGLGGVVLKGAQAMRNRSRFDRRFQPHAIQNFSGWADAIWRDTAAGYSLSAVRTAAYLGFSYPSQGSPYYGIQLTERDAPVAWVQMLDCRPRDRSYFGDMRVAALVDGVGPAPAIPSLVHCAVEAARERNADVVISNQMHRDWTAALKSAGFWRGPSNYLLALSKDLSRLLEPLDEAIPLIHFNRGDGDGRVNLYTDPSR